MRSFILFDFFCNSSLAFGVWRGGVVLNADQMNARLCLLRVNPRIALVV